MLFKTGCLGSGRRTTDNYFSFIVTNAGWTGASNVHPIPSGLKYPERTIVLVAPRDGLFAAAPRILRCAPDRRRETRRRPTGPSAQLSNRLVVCRRFELGATSNR